MSQTRVFDSIIVGGGPAGQSAAIYLARFNRSVIVLDRGTSRTLSYELNENYLGFPHGIHSRKLYELGREQASRFGAQFFNDEAKKVHPIAEGFKVAGLDQTYFSRSLIIASGVTDLYPNFENYRDYLGKSVFWCITCDGYKTIGKRVMIVGDTDEAACTALQFLAYTDSISLITNYPATDCAMSDKWRQNLAKRQVPIHYGVMKKVHGQDGFVTAVELDTGEIIETDFLFNLQGAVPNNNLAGDLGVKVNEHGYIETNDEQRTNIPFVYAAGDVTRMFAHQIVTAAHEGSMAAQAANYDLYDPDQRI